MGSNQPYLVGERGPELFIPEGPGRIIPNQGMGQMTPSPKRPTNITINITNQGSGSDMTGRSAAQVAVAVRRAMNRAERDL